MSERVNLGKSAPPLYQAVMGLEKLSAEAVASANIPAGFSHLLRLRASQLNQCASCGRTHTPGCLTSGESSDRISVLPAGRETGYFTEKERSSLALVEAITPIAEGQAPDAIYEQAAANLSKDEISAVEWLSVVINTWNRIATSSRYPVQAWAWLTHHSSRSRCSGRPGSGVGIRITTEQERNNYNNQKP